MNDAINTVIAAVLRLKAIAVIHCLHQVNNQLLKKRRCLLHDLGEQIIS